MTKRTSTNVFNMGGGVSAKVKVIFFSGRVVCHCGAREHVLDVFLVTQEHTIRPGNIFTIMLLLTLALMVNIFLDVLRVVVWPESACLTCFLVTR